MFVYVSGYFILSYILYIRIYGFDCVDTHAIVLFYGTVDIYFSSNRLITLTNQRRCLRSIQKWSYFTLFDMKLWYVL